MNENISTSSDNCHRENDSVPIVASFKCTQMLCIFCATECPPAFVIERGELVRIKEEMELNSFGCEDVILARQLRAINIMRNILDIRKETCYKLLAHFDGQFSPEFWVKVCVSCKVLVEDYNTTRREIARLEKKAKRLKDKLKGFIATSNEDEELDVDSLVWREIREEVLDGFEETPPAPLIIEDKQLQEELLFNVQMEVVVGPEFRVKTELQEESESLARSTLQPTVNTKQAAAVGMRKKVGVSKTGRATQEPLTKERNGESEANSVKLNSDPDEENNNDTIREEITLPNDTAPIKVENETTNAATRGNLKHSVKTIWSLPAKILKRILRNLEGTDLLNSRLVHSQWKAVLSEIMEQKLLSFFTKWHNHKSDGILGLDTLIPALWIKLNPRNLKGKTFIEQQAITINLMKSFIAPDYGTPVRAENYSHIFSPPGLFKKLSQNPFPSSSLRFGMRPQECHLSGIPENLEELEIYPFFVNYGHFLTNLVLDGYRVHVRQFAELLFHVPKLKSLTLTAAQFHGGESFNWNVSALPSLQHLTHLRCDSLGYGICGALKPKQLLWILEKYGNQLIGLTVTGNQYLSLKYVEKLGKTIQFGKLKQLKVDSSNTAILKLTREAKLSHIMIKSHVGDENSVGLMLPLIESFSKTLEYLWIPSKIGELGQNDGAVVNFHKVKELAIRVQNQGTKMLGLNSLLKPRFRAVEKLELIHYSDVDVWTTFERTEKQYWKLLPKLKVITTVDFGHDMDHEEAGSGRIIFKKWRMGRRRVNDSMPIEIPCSSSDSL